MGDHTASAAPRPDGFFARMFAPGHDVVSDCAPYHLGRRCDVGSLLGCGIPIRASGMLSRCAEIGPRGLLAFHRSESVADPVLPIP